MKKYICTVCGFIYDEAVGIPSAGIPAGTKWDDLPKDWICPLCGASKSEFKEKTDFVPAPVSKKPVIKNDSMKELSVGEVSALCSNLAKGCEKQYLGEEAALFTELANYFRDRTAEEDKSSTSEILSLIENDLNDGFVSANAVAGEIKDRGALRALVWSEKVTRILKSLLTRYEKDGDAFIINTNVYVCETCGFVYVGENPPDICPVCKVPNWKFTKIERR